MTLESNMLVIAPLLLFIVGVLIIPLLVKPRIKNSTQVNKLIDELEKKYIY